MNNSLKQVKDLSDDEKTMLIGMWQKLEIPFDLPFEQFVRRYINLRKPQVYGTAIQKRIIKECNSHMSKTNNMKNMGDAIASEHIFEIKVARYLETNGGTFRVTHVRLDQKIKFFLILSITDWDMHFQLFERNDIVKNPLITLSNMNGNKISNKKNKNIEKSFTLDSHVFNNDLREFNLLNGTSLNDLLKYLDYLDFLKRNGIPLTRKNMKYPSPNYKGRYEKRLFWRYILDKKERRESILSENVEELMVH